MLAETSNEKNTWNKKKKKLSLKGILKKVIWATHLSDLTEIKERVVGRVAQSVQRLSYGLDGPGSNPGGDEDFRPGTHTASSKMGTGSFRGS